MISEKIFRKDTKGVLRFWQYEVEGPKWRGISGIVGGAAVTSGWSSCTPKSQDTAEAQALFEGAAEEKKKLDRKYRRDPNATFDDVFIQPMLAQEYDKLKKPLSFPVLAQPKLDGIRAIITVEGAASRQGQPIESVDHILEQLAPVFAKYPDLVLDGELYNHDFREDFNSLSSVIRKGFKVDKKALKAGVTEKQQREALAERQRDLIQYHVYDIADPDAGDTATRENRLFEMFRADAFNPPTEDFTCPSVKVVRTAVVNDQARLDALLEEWLSAGYEGQMVRLIDAAYEHTRSKALLKRKDFETKEFKLLRIEEGNGNWAGKAKRVVVELEDGRENEAGIRGTMPFCEKLLEEKDLYEGGDVTIRYMKQRTPDGKLRAPVAIDFHPEGRKD
ncbi:DNA ligase [Mesorhizobium phage Cp1R7A-A1]|nr:DNA ligase [Mesorhizobium phage Cp1R7A-A1]